MPIKKGTRRFYEVPGYSVFYQLLARLDPEVLALALNGWLHEHAGTLPTALSLDGKMIRDVIGSVTLADHEDGSPVALAVMDQKEGTPRCEQTAALALIASLPTLEGQTVTADPLHCQRELGRVIVEKGGEYLFQIKGNQKKLLIHARRQCDQNERSHEGWINLIRGHWAGVENRNHWRRDAIGDEDGTRSRKPNIVGNLALLRSAAMRSINHHYPDRSHSELRESFAANPLSTLTLLRSKS